MWYKKLKLARKVTGMTTSDVEKKTGVAASYISKVENGKIDEPGFFKISTLLEFYHLDRSDMTD